MNKVLSTEQIREVESQHFSQRGMPEEFIIEQVGRSLYELVANHARDKKFLIICGKGNNAADALVLGRLLKFHSFDVTLCFPLGKTNGSKQFLKQIALVSPFNLKEVAPQLLNPADFEVVIDGVFGIGASLPMPEEVRTLFNKVSLTKTPVWAIDTPSGICAVTGQVDEAALKCEKTYCIGGIKWFQFSDQAFEKSGELITVDACFDQSLYPTCGEFLTGNEKPKLLKDPHAYKNKKGHVLVVGGSAGMTGAPILSACAALKVGAGLITIATLAEVREEVSNRSPVELMIKNIDEISKLDDYQVIVFGPGISKDNRFFEFLQKLKHYSGKVVFDAGFFDLIDFKSFDSFFSTLKDRCVLTPHPGEFNRFFQYSEKELNYTKITNAVGFATKHQVTLIYKSFRTLAFNSDGTINYLCRPVEKLGTAGSGDVLSGIIAAKIVQGNLKLNVAAALSLHNQVGHQLSDFATATEIIDSL